MDITSQFLDEIYNQELLSTREIAFLLNKSQGYVRGLMKTSNIQSRNPKKAKLISTDKSNELIGRKFGFLTVVVKGPTQGKIRKWICKCDCGNSVSCTKQSLEVGTNMSCGCFRANHRGPAHKNYKGIGDISLTFYNKIKHIADKRNIKFNISLNYLWELFKKQDGRCKISGLQIRLPLTQWEYAHGIKTASLDRINSAKGYIEGNVQWVHKDINMMKQGYEESYFLSLCQKISDYQKILCG